MVNKQYNVISFYIVAHADDWQLFMQPNAYNNLVANGSKVVFIITTAGDAGTDETYWKAREEGIKSSVRFCLAPLAAVTETQGSKEFNGHLINYWSANNVSCYFLRLPDGNLDGSGFPKYHFNSLSKFKEEKINSITAVDNSATYNSWISFYTNLQTIIDFESESLSNIWINYLNPDTSINPNDHADHIATGQAIQEMPVITTLHQTLYVGYSVSNSGKKLHPTDSFWKCGMFSAYEKAVYDNSGYSTLKESIPTYLKWCMSTPKFTTVNPG